MRTLGFAATMALAAAITTVPAMALTPAPDPSPNPAPQVRGQMGSNRNIVQIEQRLNNIIDQLAHDQSDYGGHKAKAIQMLRAAQEQLNKAEHYAAAHGR